MLVEDNFVEKIDVTPLADGVYFVRIAVEGTIITKKIIVKK
ncbi:MAG: T9SS type A sorting domain-containing protein [Candidatus Symbiothrix sp.]|nr:T9SS type A sorting domain-containing protein [Candidatus Symbiothrix sp.]